MELEYENPVTEKYPETFPEEFPEGLSETLPERQFPEPIAEKEKTLDDNPMVEERQRTDEICVYILSFIIFLWFCTVVRALLVESKDYSDLSESRKLQLIQFDLMRPSFSLSFPLCTVLGALIAAIYIWVLSQSIGKFIYYVALFYVGLAIIIAGLLIGLIGFLIVLVMSTGTLIGTLLILLILLAFLLFLIGYYVVSFRCILKVGAEAVYETIQDACRALRTCPNISIFACGISVVIVVISIFLFYISRRLMLSDCSDGALILFNLLNLIGAWAVIGFIANFALAVISGNAIDWYWSKDGNLSSVDIRRNVEMILNYHMGTVCFFSIPLLPHMWSIYYVYTTRHNNSEDVYQCSYYTRFCSQARVFLSIADFGLIQTSIYGHEGRAAITSAHDLVTKNNHEMNLAINEISNMAFAFGSTLITIPFHVDDINASTYSLVIPFYITLIAMCRTLLVNRMIAISTTQGLNKEPAMVQQYGTMVVD